MNNEQVNRIREEFEKVFPVLYRTYTGKPYMANGGMSNIYNERCEKTVLNFWLQKLEEQKQETHNTQDGWCCACDYDISELNHRLEVQKAELLSKIKGLGAAEEGIDLVTVAKILNKLNGTIC